MNNVRRCLCICRHCRELTALVIPVVEVTHHRLVRQDHAIESSEEYGDIVSANSPNSACLTIW